MILRSSAACTKSDTPTWQTLFPEADEYRWELGPEPEGDSDHLWNTIEHYEPTEAERRESAEMFGAMDSQLYLDRSGTMTLLELVRHQGQFFASWQNAAGDLLSSTMTALAERIEHVHAETPAELEAREEVLDDDADDVEIYRRNSREPISRAEAAERLRQSWASFNLMA